MLHLPSRRQHMSSGCSVSLAMNTASAARQCAAGDTIVAASPGLPFPAMAKIGATGVNTAIIHFNTSTRTCAKSRENATIDEIPELTTALAFWSFTATPNVANLANARRRRCSGNLRSFRMPRVYPSEWRTPSMLVPPSSCSDTKNLLMSSKLVFGGRAPLRAACRSAAVTSELNTNQGESTSGKNLKSPPDSPQNRMDIFRAVNASRFTLARTSSQKSARRSSEMSWYRPWSRRTI